MSVRCIYTCLFKTTSKSCNFWNWTLTKYKVSNIFAYFSLLKNSTVCTNKACMSWEHELNFLPDTLPESVSDFNIMLHKLQLRSRKSKHKSYMGFLGLIFFFIWIVELQSILHPLIQKFVCIQKRPVTVWVTNVPTAHKKKQCPYMCLFLFTGCSFTTF